MFNIHENIINRLEYFKTNNRIPNIIFHGSSGSGKHTIVNNFIKSIYDNDFETMKKYVLKANCAHGKGIKFIREDIKFFAKTNVNNSNNFKTIILENADFLTIDAQSALRRCIELFSHTTRFFIIVDDKYKLLRPILSRFCEIHVPLPYIKNKKQNLNILAVETCFKKNSDLKKYNTLLTAKISSIKNNNLDKITYEDIINLVNEIYELGFCSLDLFYYIENNKDILISDKYELLLLGEKLKNCFKNEKLFMLYIFSKMFIR